MDFYDIHSHLLFGLDDGVKREAEMYRQIELAYAEGTRGLCLTPHFHPGFYPYEERAVQNAFQKLVSYLKERHPDMEVFLGNELFYSQGALELVTSGQCRTLNGTRYLLVDFSSNESRFQLEAGLGRILNGGWIPVLAHVERYRALRDLDAVTHLRTNGVLIQMDANALFGAWGLTAQHYCRRLLRHGLIDVVASDAHGTENGQFGLRRGKKYVDEHMGTAYGERIFCSLPRSILRGEEIRKD